MVKGVSEVVATVVLLGITVTAAGSYYTISSNFQDNLNPDTELSDFDFNVESCWAESGRINLLVRNQDDEAANVTGVDIFSDKGPVENVIFSKEMVDQGETFTVNFTTTNKDLRLVSGETEIEYKCRNVDVEPADPGPGPDPVEALAESGGPNRGVIESIEADSLNITNYGGELCIGNKCNNSTGSKTSFDPGNYVREDGDKMNGTLNTEALISSDLCIGSECDGPKSPGGTPLGKSNKDAGAEFSLAVPEIVSYSDGICFGENC